MTKLSQRLPGLLLRLALVALALWGGWRGWHWWHKHHKKTVDYVTETVTVLPRLAERTTATGTLQALVTVQVGSQISGRIMKLHADFNSRVHAGDLLAELDPTVLASQLAQARANLGNQQAGVAKTEANLRATQRVLTRTRKLFEQKLATAADLDSALAAVEAAAADLQSSRAQERQARANLDLAETNLAYAQIHSPIDGVVLSRNVDTGQTVAASLTAPVLFTIARDLKDMQVHASVDEADIGKLREGMPATFTVDAFRNEAFRGVVSQLRLSPQVLQNVVTYDAVIDVENTGERLRPGMTAIVAFETARREEVLAVPNAALRWRPGPEDKVRDGKPGASDTTVAGFAAVTEAQAATASTDQGGKKHKKKRKHDAEAQELATMATATDGVLPNHAYVLIDGELAAVSLVTGISDGRFTEVVSGQLAAGDRVVVRKEGGGSGVQSNSSGGTGKQGKLPKKLF